jgi:hypothetical protein
MPAPNVPLTSDDGAALMPALMVGCLTRLHEGSAPVVQRELHDRQGGCGHGALRDRTLFRHFQEICFSRHHTPPTPRIDPIRTRRLRPNTTGPGKYADGRMEINPESCGR